MTIKAILRNGLIQPVEPLPPDWTEGQELVVEDPEVAVAASEVEQWSREIEAAAAKLPAEEHDRFRRAMDDIERESKETVRREWGLP